MRRLAISLIALFVIALPPSADAARKLRDVQPTAHAYRLVVVTAPGCVYCRVFQRDIEPSYEKSPHGSQIPLVYIDINEDAAGKLQLVAPVRIVPTVILVDGDREVSRIAGYVGPTTFFKVFKHMLARR